MRQSGAAVIYLAILGMAAQALATPAAESERVVLWQTLKEGMSAEEAAAALRLLDAIKSVSIKPGKKPSLNIKYTANGIEVAGLLYRIAPQFGTVGLDKVQLSSEACLSLATEKYKTLRDLLAPKCGQSQTQREVTEARELVAIRDTFSTTPTRVQLRWEPGGIPQHTYGQTGFARVLAQIANDAADAEVSACPTDAGQKATIQVIYSSNAKAAAADATRAAEDAQRRERDRQRL